MVLQGYLDLLLQLPLVERVEDLMERKPNLISGPLQPSSLDGRVEFRDVTFTYPSRPGHEVSFMYHALKSEGRGMLRALSLLIIFLYFR